MKFSQATKADFPRILQLYREVCDQTKEIGRYARWVFGQHPSEDMIRTYLEAGAIYYGEQEGAVVSAAAITPQTKDYHGAAWTKPLKDEDVAVVHLLCVSPSWQKRGIARQMMSFLLDHSRQTGKQAVRLDALSCNDPAHRLYQSLGFHVRDHRQWYASNVGWADFVLYEYPMIEGE